MFKFCPKCGTKAEGFKFCPGCGFKCITEEEEKALSNKKPEGKTGIDGDRKKEGSIPKERPSQRPERRENCTHTDTCGCISAFDYETRPDGTYVIKGIKDSYAIDVIIPEKTSVIAKDAFANARIMSVKLPDSLVYIDDRAFKGCTRLSSINIPNSVVMIGDEAFSGCSRLKIQVPQWVSIGQNAFLGTGNASRADAPTPRRESNTTPTREGLKRPTRDRLERPPRERSERGVRPTIPRRERVDRELEYLTANFDCERLSDGTYIIYGALDTSVKSIVVPSIVSEIGEGAFEGCGALEEIVVGSSVKRIGYDAFMANVSSLLIKIDFCQELLNDTVMEMIAPEFAQYEITFSSDVVEIPEQCFFECGGIEYIKIPSTVREIGDEAFYGCMDLKRVEIGKGIKKIGEDAFRGIDNLEVKLYLSQELMDYIACLTNVFDETADFELYYDRDVKCIPDSFFADAPLSTFVIPDTVEEIGEDAFVGCEYMTELVLGKGLKKIASSAVDTDGVEIKINFSQELIENMETFFSVFPETSSLMEASFDETVTRIPFGFFEGTDMKEIRIPNTVKSIEDEAFKDCKYLKQITLGDKVSYLGIDVFQNCPSLRTVYLSSKCPLSMDAIAKMVPSNCRVARIDYI